MKLSQRCMCLLCALLLPVQAVNAGVLAAEQPEEEIVQQPAAPAAPAAPVQTSPAPIEQPAPNPAPVQPPADSSGTEAPQPPAEPQTPEQPEKPAEPDKPAQPDKPDQPKPPAEQPEVKNGWIGKAYWLNGTQLFKLQKIDDILYYLDPDNDGKRVEKDSVEIDGVIYTFDKDGKCIKEEKVKDGWIGKAYWKKGSQLFKLQKIGSDLYYLDPNNQGQRLESGTIKLDGVTYTFDKDGRCIKQETIKDGWSGKTYWVKGSQIFGFHTIDGKLYYFDQTKGGSRLENCEKRIGETLYAFDKAGVASKVDESEKSLEEIIKDIHANPTKLKPASKLYSNRTTNRSLAIANEKGKWVIKEQGKFKKVIKEEKFIRLMEVVSRFEGWEYVWGGKSPSAGGFDCSGLCTYAYENAFHLGINPGYVGAESLYLNYCQPVNYEDARPGDLVFWLGTYGHINYVSHVGIYCGDDIVFNAGNPIGFDNINDFKNMEGGKAQYLFGRISVPGLDNKLINDQQEQVKEAQLTAAGARLKADQFSALRLRPAADRSKKMEL